jgi:hypothetical protein
VVVLGIVGIWLVDVAMLLTVYVGRPFNSTLYHAALFTSFLSLIVLGGMAITQHGIYKTRSYTRKPRDAP